MTDVTNILYWISTGLLIPTIALLLVSFVRCLLLLGGFFGMFINRMKYQKVQQPIIDTLQRDLGKLSDIQDLKGNKNFTLALDRLVEGQSNQAVQDKVLADFEITAEKDLSTSKSLSKIGPMLGLMGTLIPMGPALVGLASGDIATMAQNMQVAFATTVVGIFVGGIGYVTQLVKQRWFVEDLNNLEFISKLIKS